MLLIKGSNIAILGATDFIIDTKVPTIFMGLNAMATIFPTTGFIYSLTDFPAMKKQQPLTLSLLSEIH